MYVFDCLNDRIIPKVWRRNGVGSLIRMLVIGARGCKVGEDKSPARHPSVIKGDGRQDVIDL